MFAICIEASHARGMGHFFRSLVLADALREVGARSKFYLNDHAPSRAIIAQRGYDFEVVPLMAPATWEEAVIERDGISVWVNDRHRTERAHASRIKQLGLPLVTFDDRGEGAALSDLNIAGLALDPGEDLQGGRVLRGLDYLILNPDIARFRRQRTEARRWIVTMGGADTYGVTIEVLRQFASVGRPATVILGPAFMHWEALAAFKDRNFEMKCNVPSLIEELARHDVAVTGGGMTAVEASASGLATIIVANETFEVPVGRALAAQGAALFAGYHKELDPTFFTREPPVAELSAMAVQRIPLDGVRRVVEALHAL